MAAGEADQALLAGVGGVDLRPRELLAIGTGEGEHPARWVDDRAAADESEAALATGAVDGHHLD